MENIVFGPVPSRRLGRSIGINNIPYKVCSYSCNYCQVGKAVKMQVNRQEFYHPDLIMNQVGQKLKSLSADDYPDFLTLVPDGEPTLDIHLGELILRLQTFGIPIAVITNSSLLSNHDVQEELSHADYVSVKVDSINPFSWKKINKPHKELNHDFILKAIPEFSSLFKGELVTETMLINEINDTFEELKGLAKYLCEVKPKTAYIAIPTRPPAFEGTFPADEMAVTYAWEIFNRHGLSSELLTGYEGNAFASSGNFNNDMISITAVHPMRKDAVLEMMAKANASPEDLDDLISNGLIKKLNFNNQEYYLRKFKSNKK